MPWRRLITIGLAIVATVAFVADAGAYIVTNTNDSGPGSLYLGIVTANASPGPDLIEFDIPGAGPHVISPPSALPLPAITEAVIIDGYTQPGASANTNPLTSCDAALGTDAVIMVVIDGSLAGGNPGLVIQAPDCLVKGLSIVNFAAEGILIGTPASNTRIEGNFIGVLADGSASAGNYRGVKILDSAGNTIGGTTAESRNLIAAGDVDYVGVLIENQGSSANEVLGNQFGTTPDGLAALPGVGGGRAVEIVGAAGNIVGGTTCEKRNVIGNHNIGVHVVEGGSNDVYGNYLGTNLNGDLSSVAVAIPNVDGIRVDESSSNELGDDVGNLIAYNYGHGIVITGTGVRNAIHANSIGYNDGLGIDLNDDGVTTNDWWACDSDNGPNGLQNYPYLLSAKKYIRDPFYTQVEGWIISTASTTFWVEIFVSPECDPVYLYGEGLDEVMTAFPTTGGLWWFSCGDSFTQTFFGGAAGDVVTMTATDPFGSTSEFSKCAQISWAIKLVPIDVTWLEHVVDSWRFGIAVANRDEIAAGDLTATLTVPDPAIVVTDSTAFYGDLPAGGSNPGDGFTIDTGQWQDDVFLSVLKLEYTGPDGQPLSDRQAVFLSPGVVSAVGPGAVHGGAAPELRAYPNPANPGAVISFELAISEPVRLRIYNLRGQLVRSLVDETLTAGVHEIVWDGRDDHGAQLASGVYHARLQAGVAVSTSKIVLLK